MPTILRARKDLVDPRPIRIRPGPSFYNYYWKVWALLDLNNDGEYVLPFSRRLIHSDRQLWPRSHRQPPPPGSELCGCIGCESKTWEDHVLKDYDDDPNNGNLHLQEVYIESEDEEQEKQNETSKDDADDNDQIMVESDALSSSSSSTTDDSNMDDTQDSSIEDISDPPSPFAYDPYESYDWEC